MKKYTAIELEKMGYHFENALIESSDIVMGDHGCCTFNLGLKGGGWGCTFGGYCLGHGYIGADHFDDTEGSLTSIMMIMDTIGVYRLSDLEGKYCRVAIRSFGDTVKIIGNIIHDKWFDWQSFFEDYKEEKE